MGEIYSNKGHKAPQLKVFKLIMPILVRILISSGILAALLTVIKRICILIQLNRKSKYYEQS